MATKQLALLAAIVSVAMGGNLMEEMTKAGATKVVELLKATGLDQAVDNGYLTLFAPSNAAFEALPDDLSNTLASNATVLQSILQFHATKHIFRAEDAFNDMLIESELVGSKVRVNVYGDSKTGPMFITLNGAKVLKANIPASNGIVHVIDSVMLPPLGNFYDLVAMSDIHKVLKGVIDSSGTQAELDAYTGTFFAPTDTAFGIFNAVMQANGFSPDNQQITKEFVRYHVLGNVVYSAGAMNGSYPSLDQGEKVYVTIADDGSVVKINQAKVILGDIPTTNGVIHIIDSVLVPEQYATNIVVG